jgi:hypothetical protein
LAVTFPLSGRFRDLHPLEYVRAGRTDSTDDLNDLRELIKANTRIIDLLSKRIDLLEQKL